MCFDQEKTQAPPSPRVLRTLREEIEAAEKARSVSGAQVGCSISEEEIIAAFFKYHAPNEVTIPKYAAINQAAKNFAEVVLANCPRGADRSAAIRLIRDARMTANAAVALNGLSLY